MRLFLSDLLALAGRLSDQPDPDSGRERFRRLLSGSAGVVDNIRQWLDDARHSPDDQSQRALTDLVVALGRHLGFGVSYGAYERPFGAVRFDGAWRSPGVARVVLEARTDRTRPYSPDDFARTIAALPDVEPPAGDQQTVGLCVVVPLHGARRRTDAPSERVARANVHVLPIDILLSLVERIRAEQIAHEQLAALMVSGADGSSVARLLTEASAAAASDPAASSHLSLVPREEPPDHWIATIVGDEGATPQQIIDAVVCGRQLLGVRRNRHLSSQCARTGSRVLLRARDRRGRARATRVRRPTRWPLRSAMPGGSRRCSPSSTSSSTSRRFRSMCRRRRSGSQTERLSRRRVRFSPPFRSVISPASPGAVPPVSPAPKVRRRPGHVGRESSKNSPNRQFTNSPTAPREALVKWDDVPGSADQCPRRLHADPPRCGGGHGTAALFRTPAGSGGRRPEPAV